jgi:hypothetical protein
MLLVLLRTNSPLTRMARVGCHGALHGEAAEGAQHDANFIVRPDRQASLLPWHCGSSTYDHMYVKLSLEASIIMPKGLCSSRVASW